MRTPGGDPGSEPFRQPCNDLLQAGRHGRNGSRAGAGFAFRRLGAEQGVELLCYNFSVSVEFSQECPGVLKSHGLCNPRQVGVVRRKNVGLLVVQVLDPVLHAAQEHIGRAQRLDGGCRHQRGWHQARQRVECAAGAQLRELPAAYHLQQLHRELDFADAATRQLHVIGAFGMPGATPSRVFADLPMQNPQCIKNVVVQVTPEYKGQDSGAQFGGGAVQDDLARCHDPALEPGEALPFASLHMEILFQRAKGYGGWPGVAIRAQREIEAEHEAVFCHLTDQAVNGAHYPRKVFLVGNAVASLGVACGFAVLVIDIDQVYVARHVELAAAQFAHADHP